MSTKKLLSPIHIQTLAILIGYFLFSNFIFIHSLTFSNLLLTFFVPLVFGIISSSLFLFLFAHQDFFPFITNLEKAEKKSEEKYLSKFLQYGKFITALLVGIVGGPIFLALTIRILFKESENRYLVANIVATISTFLWIASAKGLLGVIF